MADKMLTRYATSNAVLRELLQNADDADATQVKIHYRSGSTSNTLLESVLSTPFSSVEISNNGKPFRDEDWGRLKRIAEGNTDPNKIGAFGVGFYSVFSITDSPFVVSGRQCVNFRWGDGGQLLFQQRQLQPEDMVNGTTIMLNIVHPTQFNLVFPLAVIVNRSLSYTGFWQRV
jgi:HSP90 family molecular chaperone